LAKNIKLLTLKPQDIYSNKIRVRVCGVYSNQQGIILVNHVGLTTGDFWSPPGGAIHFGETAEGALVREFKEETHLEVTVGKFLFACEYVSPPLHAVELFFEIVAVKGKLALGSDPELNTTHQQLKEVKFLRWPEIKMLPSHYLHGIFRQTPNPSDIKNLSGYFKV
jgi:8-oxo-dGTP diphosphatase